MTLKKIIMYSMWGLLAVGAGLYLLYLWFDFLPWESLWRILITFIILIAVMALFMFIRSDISDEERMKKNKFMD